MNFVIYGWLEEFPANENLLLEQGDTVQMGDHWVTWTGQKQEGIYLNYQLQFFEEQENGALVPSFELAPRIQLNERMGNVAEPSTRHEWHRDLYTHITYADLRTEEELSQDEWGNEIEMEMSVGDSHFIYGDYRLTLDTIVAESPKEKDAPDYIILGAGLSLITMKDSTYKTMPLFMVQGNEIQHFDSEIEALGLRFSLDRINYETNRPVVKITQHREAEQPFILVQAMVFPWINLLWTGSVLLGLGTFVAIFQRIKLHRQRS